MLPDRNHRKRMRDSLDVAIAMKYHLYEADFWTTSRAYHLRAPMKLTSNIDRS